MMPNDKLGNAFWIAGLLEKHIRKEQLTPGEQEAIEKWLAVSEGNRALFERITDESQLALALVELQGADTESALVKAHARIDGNVRPRVLRWRWAAAAAVLVFIAVGVGIYRYAGNNQVPTARIDIQEDVLPGGNRATLTLASGQTIDLSDAQQGIIVGDGITYLDGSLVLGEQVDRETSEQVHTLTTPKGGTYQITLPDGTKVWLNAASSLRYPGSFDGDERVVELEGEAYFEVSEQVNERSQKMPFKVITSGQTVEVLGTRFNISAYADDPEIKTTLVEGKVKVALAGSTTDRSPTTDHRPPITLSPGEQSTVRARLPGQGAVIGVQQVDVNQYTAWKDGLFIFNNEPLENILKQVARWYDVEVDYQDDSLRGLILWGKISRNTPMSSVLNALALTEKVQFELTTGPENERRLTVMK